MTKLKQIISIIYSLMYRKKCILFESGNNEFDNGFVFFKYCLENNCFPNNRLIFVSQKSKNYYHHKIKSKNFFLLKNKKLSYLKLDILSRNAEYIYFSYDNFWRYMYLPNTKIIFIKHGEFPLKNVKEYYDSMFNNNNKYYVLCNTKFIKKKLENSYPFNNVKYFVSGMPRNDQLKNFNSLNLDRLIGEKKKNIMVACTYRSFYKQSDFFKDEFPIYFGKNDLILLNKFLANNNINLLFKIHHAQIISDEYNEYSNIIFINNKTLKEKSISNFDLFNYVDALITDYSNIYIGFLKTNKQIGFIKTDINEYRRKRGFTIDNIEEFQPGLSIRNIDDLKKFILNVIEENDEYVEKRKEVSLKLVGDYSNSCESLVIATKEQII